MRTAPYNLTVHSGGDGFAVTGADPRLSWKDPVDRDVRARLRGDLTPGPLSSDGSERDPANPGLSKLPRTDGVPGHQQRGPDTLVPLLGGMRNSQPLRRWSTAALKGRALSTGDREAELHEQGHHAEPAGQSSDLKVEENGGRPWNRTRHGSPRRSYSPLPHLAARRPPIAFGVRGD